MGRRGVLQWGGIMLGMVWMVRRQWWDIVGESDGWPSDKFAAANGDGVVSTWVASGWCARVFGVGGDRVWGGMNRL